MYYAQKQINTYNGCKLMSDGLFKMGLISGNKIPLYHQIAQALKQRVRTGLYRGGSPLPSLRALGEEFKVSPSVIYRAVRDLEEDGIVVTHHGKEVRVQEEEGCEKAAIVFGFIHPYGTSMAFSLTVLGFVNEAFEDRSNFCVVSSSKDDPARERDVANHLIANGIKGLMVWPVNDDPNGEFFNALSKKIPVVLVDRLLRGVDLPAVVLDYYKGGKDIIAHLFGTLKKKRLLVLMDDLKITSYEDITRGINEGAIDMGRETDVTIVQLPITKLLESVERIDFSGVDQYSQYVDRLLEEGSYDAVFSSQGAFINFVLVEMGVMDRHRSVQLATLADGTHMNTAGKKFNSLGILHWYCGSAQMVARAADLVQRWVLTRQMPKGITYINLVSPKDIAQRK
jgi:DNA-binding LacI/PurR family transcriptional regulator